MKKRQSAEQIVGLLRQADVALGQGQKVPEVCKQGSASKRIIVGGRSTAGWLGSCRNCRRRTPG